MSWRNRLDSGFLLFVQWEMTFLKNAMEGSFLAGVLAFSDEIYTSMLSPVKNA